MAKLQCDGGCSGRGRRDHGQRRGCGRGRASVSVMSHAARDAERRDEDVEQHDEVQQVGGHVLPERDTPECHPLLSVLVLLFDEERMMLLCLGQLLLSFGLLLLTERRTQVLTSTSHFVVEVDVTGTLLRRFLHHLVRPPAPLHNYFT